MNILHITTFLQGGAGRILKDLAVRQVEDGHSVTVAVSGKEEPGYENYQEYLAELSKHDIEVCKLDSTFKRDIYKNVNAVSAVNSLIVKKNINIIHSHAAVPSMVAMMAKCNIKRYIPIIQTMHGWGTNKNEFHEKMDISILNMVDRVVTVSDADRNLLESKGVNESVIKRIYNGIEDDISYYRCDSNTADKIQSFKGNSILLGCIGTVCSRKNQKIIIDALSLLKDVDIKVVFIGEGPDIEELKVLCKKYKIEQNVMFLGYTDKAFTYIDLFDYTILPSLSEGMPLTILESFRAGIPVIASDIEVCKEIIKDRENGFTFKSNNVKNLCDLMKELKSLKNNKIYDDISKECHSEFLEYYTQEKMYENYMDEYKRL